jgi:hypothetical protein
MRPLSFFVFLLLAFSVIVSCKKETKLKPNISYKGDTLLIEGTALVYFQKIKFLEEPAPNVLYFPEMDSSVKKLNIVLKDDSIKAVVVTKPIVGLIGISKDTIYFNLQEDLSWAALFNSNFGYKKVNKLIKTDEMPSLKFEKEGFSMKSNIPVIERPDYTKEKEEMKRLEEEAAAIEKGFAPQPRREILESDKEMLQEKSNKKKEN